MEKNKYTLTQKAQDELNEIKNKLEKNIIDEIISQKSYPGVDEIEITQSDVKRAYLSSSPKSIFLRRRSVIRIAAYLYFTLGLSSFIYSLNYDYINDLIRQRSEQSYLLIFGVIFMIASGFFLLSSSKYLDKNFMNEHFD